MSTLATMAILAGCCGVTYLLGFLAGRAMARRGLGTPSAADFLRLGGRLINRNDWPDEVLDKLRQDYFLPPAKGEYLVRADLSAGCPAGHISRERIGLFARTAAIAASAVSAIQRGRMEITCLECGKTVKVSGKSSAYEGKLEAWDGAT